MDKDEDFGVYLSKLPNYQAFYRDFLISQCYLIG